MSMPNYACTLASGHPQCRWWPNYLCPNLDRLFIIERNKNANLLVYDAKYAKDQSGATILDPVEPIDIYWLSYAYTRKPAKEDLVWFERTVYFGYDFESASKTEEGGYYINLRLLKGLNRRAHLFVDSKSGHARLKIEIRGKECYLRKIFMNTNEYVMGVITKTTYVELFGISVASGEEVYEKITF
eukprot:TRINITY_DN1092_c2_g1_i1.p1 TRINITY_DN1092_c2_g1~~TRINITY_DN1092_c2_g1_i1.p1  ORF type:complete len:195 (+),score=29.91 TRINITY_DN1092_c2_g1_i1:28-585(+)